MHGLLDPTLSDIVAYLCGFTNMRRERNSGKPDQTRDSNATSSPCRCVPVFAKTAFNWFRTVSWERFNSPAACAIEIPVASNEASRASAGVSAKASVRTLDCGRGFVVKSENTSSARAPKNGVRAAPSTGRTWVISGRLAVRRTMIAGVTASFAASCRCRA
jgi:hypothetical protein